MAISDYDSLVAEVQRANARSNSAFVAAMPHFVGMAEQRLYDGFGNNPDDPLFSAPLRSRIMETTGTITLTDGSGAIPANYLAMRKLTRSGDQIGLKYITPERFDAEAASSQIADKPSYYTVAAGTLSVVPTWSGDLSALYYKRFDPIGVGNKTGDLLTEHGYLYFAATMVESLVWQGEMEKASAHVAKLRGMLAGANASSNDQRYSGPLRVRPRQPIP